MTLKIHYSVHHVHVHLTLDYDNMYSETDFRPEIQFAYGQAGSGDPPLTVSLTIKYPFFTASHSGMV